MRFTLKTSSNKNKTSEAAQLCNQPILCSPEAALEDFLLKQQMQFWKQRKLVQVQFLPQINFCEILLRSV